MAPGYLYAFPMHHKTEQLTEDGYRDAFYSTGGMTLRDYFAAKALQGMCSGQVWPYPDDGAEMASRSYRFADAMLAEREKGGK